MGKYKFAPHVRLWTSDPLGSDVERVISKNSKLEDVVQLVIMPDVHLAHNVCVGSVLATRQLLYPQAVGSDLGCGMFALAFNCSAQLLRSNDNALKLLAQLRRSIPVMRQESLRDCLAYPSNWKVVDLSSTKLQKIAERSGRLSLGTLGRGNHFLEFQEGPEGYLWLMLHTGSRIMGQEIQKYYMREYERNLFAMESDSSEGQAWLNDMNWAVQFAELNRRIITDQVCKLINEMFGVSVLLETEISCNHDHVRKEIHFGESLWVHRKGANSAAENEPVIIAGSMGTSSYHVVGRGNTDSLRSCSHGAGRCLSRSEARFKVSEKALLKELGRVCYDHAQTYSLREEAPSAYKDITKVMRSQKRLVKIVRKLEPIITYKGS
ncbi:MAG: RtcB family protein [Lentisphaerales bacterium]|nr:RtcB family protein [Lentisphaerales bacterium]